MARMAKWKPIDAKRDRAIELRVRAEASEAEIARLREQLTQEGERAADLMVHHFQRAEAAEAEIARLRAELPRAKAAEAEVARFKSMSMVDFASFHTTQSIANIRALTPPDYPAKNKDTTE